MSRNAACVQRNAPVRLTSTTCFHCCECQILQRNGRGTRAGVVEEQVESAEGCLGRVEQSGDGIGIGHIRGNGQRSRPRGSGFRHDTFECLASSTGEHDRITSLKKCEGCRPADAGACAGDDCDLSVGSHHSASSERVESSGESRLYSVRSQLQGFLTGSGTLDGLSVIVSRSRRVESRYRWIKPLEPWYDWPGTSTAFGCGRLPSV